MQHACALPNEVVQESRVEVFEEVLAEEVIEEDQHAIQTHIDAIFLELIRVQFEEVEQVQSFGVDPQSEESHGAPERVILNEADVIIPLIYLKILIEELKQLYQSPRLLVPLVAICDLSRHAKLVLSEVLVADDVVEIGGEGHFEEGLEN